MRPHRVSINLAKFIALLVTLAALSGCVLFGGGSGEIEPQKAEGYTLKPPKDWLKKKQDESDEAYHLPSGSLVTFNSSCHRHLDASLDVLTRQLLIGSRNIVVETQYPYTTDGVIGMGGTEGTGGTDGLYTVVTATLDTVLFHLDLFVVKRASCIFDFSLVNPRTLTEKDRDQFRAFIKSFQYGNGKN